MVSTVQEFDQAKELVERELTHLRRHGHKLPDEVEIGSMVEVPSLLYQLDELLERVDFQRAPVPMAKRIRIFYMTQAAVAPPTFVLFTDRDIKLHFSFERFLENQIREAFGFKGTPIWFKVRARNAGKKE